MAQIKPKGTQLDIISVAAEIANDGTAIGSIVNGVVADPGATATLDADYLRRDGTGAMTASLNLGNFDITNVVNVASRNVALDGTNQDNHISDITAHRIINDVGSTTIDLWSASKISTELALKADKVLVPTVGNFAELDVGGNIVDSGVNASTFATTVHTHLESDITDLQAYLLDITTENLETLADVTITTNSVGEILTWSGTSWINNTLVEAGISAIGHTHLEADITDLQSYLLDITNESIVSLSDVFTTMTPVDGEVLTYDTTNGWQSEALPASPVTSVAGKTGVVTLVEADITDFGTYETAFSKNTAFNLNFGITTTTVCEGDDSRLSDARTPTAHTHVEADITDLGTLVATVATPTFTGTVGFPSYVKASLPGQAVGHMIYVSDATGASLTGSMCFSNGTVWIDVTTGAAVV